MHRTVTILPACAVRGEQVAAERRKLGVDGPAEVGVAKTDPPRSDFQPRTEVARYFDRGPVSLPRLLLRVAVVLLVLLAFDLWAGRALEGGDFAGAYRMPLELPTTKLPGYVHAIDRRSATGGIRAAFLGASPTWGYRIKRPENTFPYAFASAATKGGSKVSAANLAANGLLVGDQYLLAQAVAPGSDVVFVQLTYHMFDPRYEKGRVVRYPEIAELPGVRVSESQARLLGVPAKSAKPVGTQLDRVLFDSWTVYRERSAIADKLFGGMPEERLFDTWRRRSGTATEADTPRALTPANEFASFDSLDPEKQMIVVAQYAENASFTVSPASRQVRTLRSLVELLKAQDKKAVFFVAPLNREIVDYYALIDRTQYLANSKALGDAVRSAGFPFIDYNAAETPVFPGSYFADIDHTTDEGGRAVGARLWADTAEYVTGPASAKGASGASASTSSAGDAK